MPYFALPHVPPHCTDSPYSSSSSNLPSIMPIALNTPRICCSKPHTHPTSSPLPCHAMPLVSLEGLWEGGGAASVCMHQLVARRGRRVDMQSRSPRSGPDVWGIHASVASQAQGGVKWSIYLNEMFSAELDLHADEHSLKQRQIVLFFLSPSCGFSSSGADSEPCLFSVPHQSLHCVLGACSECACSHCSAVISTLHPEHAHSHLHSPRGLGIVCLCHALEVLIPSSLSWLVTAIWGYVLKVGQKWGIQVCRELEGGCRTEASLLPHCTALTPLFAFPLSCTALTSLFLLEAAAALHGSVSMKTFPSAGGSMEKEGSSELLPCLESRGGKGSF